MADAPGSLYVAQDGNDRWSGRCSAPQPGEGDGPFATLARARDEVRQLAAEGRLPDGGQTVYTRQGVYHLTESLQLNAADSGMLRKPVIWAACPGERVVLTGSRWVTGWSSVRDPAVRDRLGEAGRDRIVAIDLKEQGIPIPGEIAQRGSPDIELFCRGQRLRRSRWPREGWLRIADVPQSGPHRYHEGLDREKRFDGVPVGRHYGRISYEGGQPARWSGDEEIYLHGYWTWDWSDLPSIRMW